MHPMHWKSKYRELPSLEGKSGSMVISSNAASKDTKQALGHTRRAMGESWHCGRFDKSLLLSLLHNWKLMSTWETACLWRCSKTFFPQSEAVYESSLLTELMGVAAYWGKNSSFREECEVTAIHLSAWQLLISPQLNPAGRLPWGGT